MHRRAYAARAREEADLTTPFASRDLELEEQGRIAMAHGRQWDRVSGMTAPRHWLDFVDRPWERVLCERERQAEQELLDRLERMARSNVPPPLRNEERYGSRADNPAGDEAFRKDRLVWYEHVTGESLGHLTLSEQWQLVHVVARRFREYSDGRAARAREEMPPQGAPPMPQPPPAAATSAALPVPAVRLQQAPQKAAASPHVSPWQRKLQELSPSELRAERLSLQSKLDACLAEKASICAAPIEFDLNGWPTYHFKLNQLENAIAPLEIQLYAVDELLR